MAALCDLFCDVCAAGVKTGRCSKDRDSIRGTCEILAWCPVEKRSKPKYVAILCCFQAWAAWLLCRSGRFLGSLCLDACLNAGCCSAGGSSAWPPRQDQPSAPPSVDQWLPQGCLQLSGLPSACTLLTNSLLAAWGKWHGWPRTVGWNLPVSKMAIQVLARGQGADVKQITNPSLPGNRFSPVQKTSLFTSRIRSASPSLSSPSECGCSEIPLSSPSQNQ